MYIVLLVCVTGFQFAGSCRFGDDNNCAFQCRCETGSCDSDSGSCLSGRCTQVPPADNGFGWKGKGCRSGNVAYQKNTSQSGMWASYSSDKAVDGNTNPRIYAGYCAHPLRTDNGKAWWMVDLGKKHTIEEIIIFNRDSYQYRTRNFDILLGMSSVISEQTKCLYYDGPAKTRLELACTAMSNTGQYVTIKRTGGSDPGQMNICEVVIIGYETIECSSNNCLNDCDAMIGCDTCRNGTKLPDCTQDCDINNWGSNCANLCGNCALGQTCDKASGKCMNGCLDWYATDFCNVYIDVPSLENNGVDLEVLSNSEVKVIWEQYQAKPEIIKHYFYVVNYTLNGITSTSTMNHTGDANITSLLLTELTFNTVYAVKVIPYRQEGDRNDSGVPSKVIQARTLCIEPTQPDIDIVIGEKQWEINVTMLSNLKAGCDYFVDYTVYISHETSNSILWSSSVYNSSIVHKVYDPELNGKLVWTTVVNNANLSTSSIRIKLLYPITSTSSASVSPSSEDVFVDGQQGLDRDKTSVIAGSIAGVVLVLALVGVVVFIVLRRRRTGASTKYTDQMLTSTTTLVRAESMDNRILSSENVYANADDVHVEEPLTGITVSKLEFYIEQKHKEVDGFKHEYVTIPVGINNPVSSASESNNISKNRFKNIKAYDSSRVKLEIENDDPCTDYINASFIPGYKKEKTHYIAGQGPLPHTMTDTWRMVWQYNITRIVMLTNLQEMGKRKCACYWPGKAGDSQQYGEVTVKLEDVEEYADFTIRRIICSNSGTTKSVVQCHYTSWPDKQALDTALPLLQFRHKVKSFPDRGPLLIHCSAGIGRTGTYIAIDYLIEQGLTENRVDVNQCVTTMREYRMNMVQTLAQYEFIYNTILEAFTFGDTTLPCGGLESRINNLGSKMAEQYQRIDKLAKSQQHETDVFDGNSEENRQKNKDKTIIPDDLYRPYLKTPCKGHNDYINAVYVNSYSRAKAFIVTQFPLDNTVIDFWRLVYDCQCGLVVSLGMTGKADTSNEKCVYENFEAKTSTEKHGPIEVICNSETRDNDLTKRFLDVKVTGSNNGNIKTTHIEMVEWTDDDLPQIESFMELIKQVEHLRQELDGPTIIRCSNGSDKSGLLVAALYMTEYMKLEQELDVVTAVRSVRKYRNQFVCSQQQYDYLYKVAQVYNKMFSTYANIM